MGIPAHCSDSDVYSMLGISWKFARVGERLSPYVSICCILMAVRILGFKTVSDDRYPCLRGKSGIPSRNEIPEENVPAKQSVDIGQITNGDIL